MNADRPFPFAAPGARARSLAPEPRAVSLPPRFRAGFRLRPAPALASVPLRVLARAPRPGSGHA